MARPRRPENSDLPHGVIRRVRSRQTYFYFRLPNGRQEPLGKTIQEMLIKYKGFASWPSFGTFASLAEDYQRSHEFLNLAPKTRQGYTNQIIRLLNDAGWKKFLLSDVTTKEVKALKKAMIESPVMFNRLKALISAIWSWAREESLTDLPNPASDVARYPEQSRKLEVTNRMYFEVYYLGDQILRDWMDLSVVCGPRVSDVLEMKWSNVVTDDDDDEDLEKIRIKHSKTKAERAMPNIGDLNTLLDRLKERKHPNCDYLVQTEKGNRVSYSMIYNRFEKVRAEQHKITEKTGQIFIQWNPQDLRAKSAQSADTPHEAQGRMGHSKLSTTQTHYRTEHAKPGRLPARPKKPAAV